MGEPPVGAVNHSSVPAPVPVKVTIPGPHLPAGDAVGTGIIPTTISTSLEVSAGQALSVTIALNRFVANRVTS